jgi:hypothetical protein
MHTGSTSLWLDGCNQFSSSRAEGEGMGFRSMCSSGRDEFTSELADRMEFLYFGVSQ